MSENTPPESRQFTLMESQRHFLYFLAQREAIICAKQDNDGYVHGIEEEIQAIEKLDPALAAQCALLLGDSGSEIEELTRPRPRS